MSVTRLTLAAALLLYVVLWALALDGASGLMEPLVISLVLAVIVALGVALNRFIGVAPRQQHFEDREDES